MAKFIIEGIATVKHTYAIEADDMDSAISMYFDNQDTLEPVNHFFVGELLSDVQEVCCDEHWQQLVDGTNNDEQSESTEDETSNVIEAGVRIRNMN